jgi:hypothetical protein
MIICTLFGTAVQGDFVGHLKVFLARAFDRCLAAFLTAGHAMEDQCNSHAKLLRRALGFGTKLAKSGLILYWRQQTVAQPTSHPEARKTRKCVWLAPISLWIYALFMANLNAHPFL